MNLEDIITLIPRTRKAKSLARKHGTRAVVKQFRDTTVCAAFVDNMEAWCWIEIQDDPNWDYVFSS